MTLYRRIDKSHCSRSRISGIGCNRTISIAKRNLIHTAARLERAEAVNTLNGHEVEHRETGFDRIVIIAQQQTDFRQGHLCHSRTVSKSLVHKLTGHGSEHRHAPLLYILRTRSQRKSAVVICP